MLNLEARRDVMCVYPLSGQYCHAPRILYYVLAAAVILIRKHVWLAAGAAAYVMTYAAAAAIHAIILCAIGASSTSLLPDGFIELGQDSPVEIRGRVIDLDTDATFAIVGLGFLMLLPLSVFSTTFHKSEAKPILAAWGVLMLVGAVCCLVTLYTVDTTATGPFKQYRICLASNSTLSPIPTSYAALDQNWNTTIYAYFSKYSATAMPGCFYPCLYSSQILRSQSDITIIPFPDVKPGSKAYWSFKILTAFVYACIPLYIAGGLVLLLHRSLSAKGFNGMTIFTSLKTQMTTLTGIPLTAKTALQFVFVCFQGYALVFAPVVVLVFIVFAEYAMSLDPESESIRHVGQWQPLVSAGLVVIAALLSRYDKELRALAFWQQNKGSVDASTGEVQTVRERI